MWTLSQFLAWYAREPYYPDDHQHLTSPQQAHFADDDVILDTFFYDLIVWHFDSVCSPTSSLEWQIVMVSFPKVRRYNVQSHTLPFLGSKMGHSRKTMAFVFSESWESLYWPISGHERSGFDVDLQPIRRGSAVRCYSTRGMNASVTQTRKLTVNLFDVLTL